MAQSGRFRPVEIGGSGEGLTPRALLDLDGCPSLFELGLDLVGLLLGDALLDRIGRPVDQVLRLLETEARDRAHDLDHLNLLVARTGEHDVERGLLLFRSAVTACRRPGSRGDDRGGRGSRDAPLVLDLPLELDQFEHGHLAQLVEELIYTARSHLYSASFSSSPSEVASAISSEGSSSSVVTSAWDAGSSLGASSPPSCSMRASIRPTRSRSGALNRPTTVMSGDATAASTWPRSRSSGGSVARVRASSCEMALPSRMPPRTSSTRVSRAESASALATATGSPSDSRNAIAVGPSSRARTGSAPAASAARRVRVFLTTVKRAPCSSSFVRSASICFIDKPR